MNSNNIYHVDFEDVISFSPFDKAYQSRNSKLEPYIKGWPELTSLVDSARTRPYSKEQREILVETLYQQSDSIGLKAVMEPMISKLAKDHTCTVVTAHQPVLFGGPLYIIYKAISAIKLARLLEKEDASVSIQPIFVIGGEDHDREEMNHFKIYRKEIVWNTQQTGAVGRFNNDGIQDLINQTTEILGESSTDIEALLKSSFVAEHSYGEGYQYFLQTLFKDMGLLVIRMDDPILKKAFNHVAKREILEQVSQPIIQKTQEELSDLGFGTQAHAREINFFLLENNDRVLIEKTKDGFAIGNKEYTIQEMERLIDQRYADLSPNVVMRPIYQEFTLPNIAYVGGGGELAYWKERKAHFESFELPFPFLVRRDSVLCVESHVNKKMEKAGISLKDIFLDKHVLLKEKMSENIEIDDAVESKSKVVLKEFESLVEQLKEFDLSLAQYAESEARKLEKTFDNLTQKVIRSAKKQSSVRVNQIEKIYDLLFPNQGMQERVDNFLPFFSKSGKAWLEGLLEQLDPTDPRLKVIIEE